MLYYHFVIAVVDGARSRKVGDKMSHRKGSFKGVTVTWFNVGNFGVFLKGVSDFCSVLHTKIHKFAIYAVVNICITQCGKNCFVCVCFLFLFRRLIYFSWKLHSESNEFKFEGRLQGNLISSRHYKTEACKRKWAFS